MFSSAARNLYSRPSTERTSGVDITPSENPLMILRIEDKIGVIHILKFYKEDNPVSMAQQFGLTHGLDQAAISNLAKGIQNSLAMSAKKKSQKPAQELSNSFQKIKSKPEQSLGSNIFGSSQNDSLFKANLKKKLQNEELSEINIGEKKYIVGKRRTEVEM